MAELISRYRGIDNAHEFRRLVKPGAHDIEGDVFRLNATALTSQDRVGFRISEERQTEIAGVQEIKVYYTYKDFYTLYIGTTTEGGQFYLSSHDNRLSGVVNTGNRTFAIRPYANRATDLVFASEVPIFETEECAPVEPSASLAGGQLESDNITPLGSTYQYTPRLMIVPTAKAMQESKSALASQVANAVHRWNGALDFGLRGSGTRAQVYWNPNDIIRADGYGKLPTFGEAIGWLEQFIAGRIGEMPAHGNPDVFFLVVGEGEISENYSGAARYGGNFGALTWYALIANDTLGHEGGHMMRKKHEYKQDTSPDPMAPRNWGIQLQTIADLMAYREGRTRVPVYANATITYPGHENEGVMGDEHAHSPPGLISTIPILTSVYPETVIQGRFTTRLPYIAR